MLFIATANELDPIPRPLYDRMEVLEMSGYTVEEKVQIALRHLLPKQRQYHGLDDEQLRMDETVVDSLISKYTREAGVRELALPLRRGARGRGTGGTRGSRSSGQGERRLGRGGRGRVEGVGCHRVGGAHDGATVHDGAAARICAFDRGRTGGGRRGGASGGAVCGGGGLAGENGRRVR